MKRIRDVIDWDMAERLLEDCVELWVVDNRVGIRRGITIGEASCYWVIYVNGEAHPWRTDKTGGIKRFKSLADALEVACSPRQQKEWGV